VQPSRGVLNTDIATLLRPELRLDLVSALHRAFDARESTLTWPATTAFDNVHRRVLMQVTPLPDDGLSARRALVFLLDGGEVPVDDPANQRGDGSESNDLLRRLNEELRQAHDRLSASRKEHETATQELRATNEELQSINEEYRSTSEELETSKEELQSMNEELHTVNAELKSKLSAISTAHDDLQNLIAATEIGTLFLDPEMHIKLYTPTVARIFNITDSDIGRAITDFTHNLDYDGLIRDATLVRRNLAPVEKEITTRDARRLFMRMRPYRTIDDRIDGIVITFVDITSRYDTERQLVESEERFRRLVEGTAMAVWELDTFGRMVVPSVSWSSFTGQTSAEALGEGWLAVVHADDRERVRAVWSKGFADRCVIDVDFRVRESNHTWRWVKAKAAPMLWPDGDVRRWIGMCIDIDDMKRLEAHQSVLVGELQHRTRNLIGVVKGMGEQTLATSESLADFRATFSQRLEALSRVQGVLSRAEHEPVMLESLLSREFDALAAKTQRSRIRIAGPDIALPKRIVQTLAMALHELATNAMKYGSLVNDTGTLSVEWREMKSNAGKRLSLEWIEAGLDLERELEGPMVRGFGRQLIEEALPYSHGAKTTFELRKTGLRCTIDLPLSNPRADPAT
jgi:two-component system CheB/CheR fusion protein